MLGTLCLLWSGHLPLREACDANIGHTFFLSRDGLQHTFRGYTRCQPHWQGRRQVFVNLAGKRRMCCPGRGDSRHKSPGRMSLGS